MTSQVITKCEALAQSNTGFYNNVYYCISMVLPEDDKKNTSPTPPVHLAARTPQKIYCTTDNSVSGLLLYVSCSCIIPENQVPAAGEPYHIGAYLFTKF